MLQALAPYLFLEYRYRMLCCVCQYLKARFIISSILT